MLPLQQGLAQLQAGVEVLASGFDLFFPDVLVILHEQFHRGDVPGGGAGGQGRGESLRKKETLVTDQPDANS